jgi:hypothetical protein
MGSLKHRVSGIPKPFGKTLQRKRVVKKRRCRKGLYQRIKILRKSKHVFENKPLQKANDAQIARFVPSAADVTKPVEKAIKCRGQK